MFLLYFLAWIIFNGQITLEIVLFGIVISAAITAFSCKFLDRSFKKDIFIFKKAGLIIRYMGILIWEIIKANVETTKITFARDKEPSPVIVKFKTDLKTSTARVVLAHSITLTPGTITVALEDNEFTVHCLDKSLSEGMEESIFVKELRKMEAGYVERSLAK